MQPNFLVIGAPKAATTTLCALLEQHPAVYLFRRKGTQFFSRHYDFGWEWYESLFASSGDATAVGEGCPSYTTGLRTATVADRIASHLPHARLIYMARHPFQRIESHYAQMIDNGVKAESFDEAVRTIPPLVEASRYWTRISDYRRHFPDAQILVLFADDLRADPSAVMQRCFDFLEVDTSFQCADATQTKNVRADKRTDRALLRWMKRHGKLYLKVNWALPNGFVERVKPLLRRRIEADVTWSASTRKWVLDQIGDDVCQFLEFYDRPRDFWLLEDEGDSRELQRVGGEGA